MIEHLEASKVWNLAGQKLPAMRHVDTAAEIRRVLQYLATYMPDIFSGTPIPIKTEQEIVQLARALSNNASETSIQARFNYLAIGLEIGNTDFSWEVPLVPQLVKIKKPLNWATKDNFIRRAAAGRLEQAFGRDLERPVSQKPAVYFGQVLFTAVFFGGLLERKWLEPLLAAIVNREFYQYKGILWVELVRKSAPGLVDSDEEQEASSYTKRFFPDYFTQALIYRLMDCHLLPAVMPGSNPWLLLLTYLRSLPDGIPHELPGNLDEFIKLGLSRNLLLPGSLLAYATGKLRSTSLAIGPWLRCISGKAVRVIRPETSSIQQQLDAVPKITVPRKCSARKQEELFSKLLKQISPKDKELSGPETSQIFERFLKTNKHEMSPAFQLMVHWGRQLLSPRVSYLEHRSKRHAVTASTLRRYFRAINAPFLLAAAEQDLTTIDPLELELIYEQTISDRQNDNMAPRCLLQFHGFLEAFYGFPPIESVELKGSTSPESNLNANLITLDLYALVLQGLGWGMGDMSRWQRLRVVAWIICYRFGLRPTEVLNLRMIDFQLVGPGDFELLVRVSPKSERGKRRIPGSLCLYGDESRLLLEYYRQRGTELGLFGGNYLLAHPEQKSGRLADEDVYEPTRGLLHSITGDDTLRLYHARHTFNSSLQVQFQLQGKPLFDQVDFLDLDNSVDRDRQLRNALMGNESWGRKDQHVQAILVGHSTPEVTNQYYDHLNDVLLGTLARQRRDHVPISLKAMIMLSGLRQSWANELFVEEIKHPLAGLVKSQAKKFASRLQHPLLENTLTLSLPKADVAERAKLPSWETVITQDAAQVLKRGESNWDVAFKVYEGVRQLDGKRLKMAAGIIGGICSQQEKAAKRWRGPVYTSITELRSVLLLLKDIGISADSVLLVHHPRRGQPAGEQAAALKMWQERTDVPVGGWVAGEMTNETAPKKGAVEIKVTNPGYRANGGGRQPAMSRGFEIALRLLNEVILF